MRIVIWTLLCLWACIFTAEAQFSEEFIPSQRTPIGLVHDARFQCSFFIFRTQVKHHCVGGGSPGTRTQNEISTAQFSRRFALRSFRLSQPCKITHASDFLFSYCGFHAGFEWILHCGLAPTNHVARIFCLFRSASVYAPSGDATCRSEK